MDTTGKEQVSQVSQFRVFVRCLMRRCEERRKGDGASPSLAHSTVESRRREVKMGRGEAEGICIWFATLYTMLWIKGHNLPFYKVNIYHPQLKGPSADPQKMTLICGEWGMLVFSTTAVMATPRHGQG